LWILTGILLVIIAGGGYYTGFFDYLAYKIRNQEILKQIYIPKEHEQSNKQTTTLADDTTMDTTSVSPEIRRAINRMTDKKRALMYKEPEDSKTYHIIAGSFQVRSNAIDYRDQLIKKGFKAKVLENESLFRISVKSFDEKEDALVELYQMRDSGKLKSIWLLAVQEKDR
jgi:cell division protein FtsN